MEMRISVFAEILQPDSIPLIWLNRILGHRVHRFLQKLFSFLLLIPFVTLQRFLKTFLFFILFFEIFYPNGQLHFTEQNFYRHYFTTFTDLCLRGIGRYQFPLPTVVALSSRGNEVGPTVDKVRQCGLYWVWCGVQPMVSTYLRVLG